ncbi:hypothetical protein KW805_03220 [Candidatus Pacearchaeota archaeon]|nr:hypothetical protein [Candidatus Pacearchaeota archaeon]
MDVYGVRLTGPRTGLEKLIKNRTPLLALDESTPSSPLFCISADYAKIDERFLFLQALAAARIFPPSMEGRKLRLFWFGSRRSLSSAIRKAGICLGDEEYGSDVEWQRNTYEGYLAGEAKWYVDYTPTNLLVGKEALEELKRLSDCLAP